MWHLRLHQNKNRVFRKKLLVGEDLLGYNWIKKYTIVHTLIRDVWILEKRWDIVVSPGSYEWIQNWIYIRSHPNRPIYLSDDRFGFKSRFEQKEYAMLICLGWSTYFLFVGRDQIFFEARARLNSDQLRKKLLVIIE